MSTIHACFTPEQPVDRAMLPQMLAASDYWHPDATSQATSLDQHCGMAKASLFNTKCSRQDEVYHATQSGLMITASNEHNAFFTAKFQNQQIKEDWLVRHLWGLGPNPCESPYLGIELLPPAHSMVISQQGLTISRYWALKNRSDWQAMDDEALIDELKNRFRHAVKVRLDSAYPLGAELSEGLVSNGIVGYAARMLGEQPLYTFSYACEKLTDENRSIWEQTYQDIFAMHALHKNIQPVWSEAQSDLEDEQNWSRFFRHAGGVMAINGGHFLRSRLASEFGARVMLSGWGGDHCVSSYGDFYESELFRQGKWLQVHQLLRNKQLRGRGGNPVKAWAHLLLKHSTPALYRWRLRRHGGLEQALWQRARDHPLKPIYSDHYQCRKDLRQMTDAYQRDSVQAGHHRELFEIGVENRLVESELCARLYRVEYRYPMLDVPLLELAYNMPPHLKMHSGMEYYPGHTSLPAGRQYWAVGVLGKVDNFAGVNFQICKGDKCLQSTSSA